MDTIRKHIGNHGGHYAGKKSLLTLPIQDLQKNNNKNDAAALEDTNKKHNSNNGNAEAPPPPPPLMILQLPKGWSPSDLNESYIVGSSSSEARSSSQAALVVESKRSSFDLFRVETSNVLVMIPPPTKDSQQQQHEEEEAPPPSKKNKTGEKQSSLLVPVPARLLSSSNNDDNKNNKQDGSSGASFLELRTKTVSCNQLVQELSSGEHVWDPYNNGNMPKGMTLRSLAFNMQLSTHQVLQGIRKMESAIVTIAPPQQQQSEQQDAATGGHDGDDNSGPAAPSRYVLLSEEAQQEAYDAILSALSEVDDCSDYAVSGVDPVPFIRQHAVPRLETGERYRGVEHVLAHCLGMLSYFAHDRERSLLDYHETTMKKKKRVRLDVKKVASRVVRRFFQKQTTPWEETLLLSRWQSALPGVGDSYQVDTSMLAGVAILDDNCNENGGGERFWKYLPADQLPTDPAERFEALWAAKDAWFLKDLEPYLDVLLVDCAGDSHSGLSSKLQQQKAELLLRYTKVVTEQRDDGTAVKVHMRR